MVLSRRRSPIPGLLALLIMCGLILSLGVWLFLPDLIKGMTGRLMPPAFPGVEQVDHIERLEYGTATEETTFRAHAHVSAVRPWMEQRMPGFNTCTAFTPINPNCSANILCDTSFVGKGLIWLLLGEDGRRSEACVAVIILPMPGDDRFTLIRYTVSWPALMDDAQ
jgi:hypothetical protein